MSATLLRRETQALHWPSWRSWQRTCQEWP